LPSLEYGRVIQMTLWQSDKPIVAVKSLNGDGAKGLTGMRWEDRDTTARLGTGVRLSTKPKPVTCSSVGKEVFLKSRVGEIYTHGSVLTIFTV